MWDGKGLGGGRRGSEVLSWGGGSKQCRRVKLLTYERRLGSISNILVSLDEQETNWKGKLGDRLGQNNIRA